MAPSAPATRTNSIGTSSSRTMNIAESMRSESRGYSRTGSSFLVEEDPDLESGRWSFIDHGRHKSLDLISERRAHLGKFGSQHSQLSAMDMLAAGLDIASLPSYDLSVRNLVYKVSVRTREQGTQERILLNNVSADAFHSEILAVVGPSGSGKTTFLDALAGRIFRTSLQGEIFVNGELVRDSFNRISGYVMQNDALFPFLTVRETLLYSARLRLPGIMLMSEKKQRVENMIDALGLKQCADTRVGDELVRGVSGGERRRVSIGADLIHDPAVLFLDEPTSGLDSVSALNVMQKLSRMAKSGKRTVVLTIHQPSSRMLEIIDCVLVLGQGHVIFRGELSLLKDHFYGLCRPMPEFGNIIEYALDIIEDYQRSPDGLEPLISYELSKRNSQKTSEQELLLGGLDEQPDSMAKPQYATSIWSECCVLADRNFKNICRTPQLFLTRIGMMVVVGATLGTLFLQVKVDEKGIRQRTSFISFTLALLMFTSTESMGPFLAERQIFIRETSRGAYRAGTYVFSGAVVILPFLFFLALLYSSIAYWLVGLVADMGAFFFFTVVVFLSLCAANSFVIFFSGLVPDFTLGLSLVCGAIAYFFLFSGYFIERNSIPVYWIWLHYISLFKYPLELLLNNEFSHLKDVIWYANVRSSDILNALSIGRVHIWVNVLALILLFVGYRILFWIILKYFTKSIRK